MSTDALHSTDAADRNVADVAGFGEGARLAAVSALVWLACSPALRLARSPSKVQVTSAEVEQPHE